MQVKYHRVLLKLSGEAMQGKDGRIIDGAFLEQIVSTVSACLAEGVQVALIVGAGNIWRGRQSGNIERVRGDYMGMLATAINALALSDAFLRAGQDARVMTAIHMPEIGEYFTRDAAVAHLEAGRVVIFAAGTGRPFFSTDTAAALRAVEIGADAILMAKNIDGVYTADPKTDPTATKIDSITYAEMLARELRVIDLTAAALCRDSSIPTLVFRLSDTADILRAVAGETTGTVIS